VIRILAALVLLAVAMPAAADQVTLAWTHDGAQGFRIFQRLDGQVYDYSKPAWSGPEKTCTIKDLVPGQTYHFVARAFDGESESADSNEVTYRVLGPVPCKPTGTKLMRGDQMPYIISDPVPGDSLDYFDVNLDGAIEQVQPEVLADGTKRLHFDVGSVSEGSHEIIYRGVNVWGPGEWSDPYPFVKSLPGKPSGTGLSAE
jgi:hypothetical protein